MADNSYGQSQQRRQTQTAPVQENIHTAVTVTTDRTLEAPSAAQLQDLEQAVRKDDYAYGLGF
jgi:hypothetical protein